jgi:A/G-specific adenine glycosylase
VIAQGPDHPIRLKLLAWAKKQKRDLPWRGTRDPYRIWVSEVMLQQTTVPAVRARYEGFLTRFPDLASLARAREDSVLSAWSGLGYYARARNLRLAARRIVREHGGEIPRDPNRLRGLPGFGEYTAGAVACLAFGSRAPAADANVTRVLSRLNALEGTAGTAAHREAVRDRARRLLSSGSPGRLLAALMGLGQLVCLARRPECGSCPLAAECLARRRGSPESFPRRRRKPRAVEVFLAAACARRDGRVLLARRSGTLLNGLWEFPSADASSRRAASRKLASRARLLGLDLASRPIGTTRHAVVNRRLSVEVFPATPMKNSKTRIPKSLRWFTARQLQNAAIPTLTRKIARAAAFLQPAPVSSSAGALRPQLAARRRSRAID